jgi:Uncharacterized conserved protein
MTVNEEKLLRDLTIEDLQEQHRDFAEALGMENLIKLSEHFGGTSIYVPQRRELVKQRVYGLIRKEYDGTNIKELASRYDVSESTVYNVVRDILLRGAAKREAASNIPGQMDLMECMLALQEKL